MGVNKILDFRLRIADFLTAKLKIGGWYSTGQVFNDQNLGCRVSGVSAAAGRRSGQFDRKRNFVVPYELHGIRYKVEGAGRMHAI
jgi:hypothetical protein